MWRICTTSKKFISLQTLVKKPFKFIRNVFRATKTYQKCWKCVLREILLMTVFFGILPSLLRMTLGTGSCDSYGKSILVLKRLVHTGTIDEFRKKTLLKREFRKKTLLTWFSSNFALPRAKVAFLGYSVSIEHKKKEYKLCMCIPNGYTEIDRVVPNFILLDLEIGNIRSVPSVFVHVTTE